MTTALAMPRQLSLRAWARVTLRLAGMIGLLLACIPLYYAWKLLRFANPWPRIFLGGITRIAGVRTTVTGPRPRGPVFMLANHVSWIDVPALSQVTGTAFVGHDGLASMPVLEWLCRMNDTVFIARHDRASVAEQVNQVRHALADMHALTIFPEGTTSDGTGLLPFKSSLLSAFEPFPAGIAVQPVMLDYGAEAAQIAWVGEEHGLDNFLRILARRRPVRLTVAFQPALTGEQLSSRKTIAAAGRDAIMKALAG
ncbi:1-acyl-sn-glycerol-3-phosphate acyltransferase [Novosphingobium sp.]|uniref:lysophospholipid acyltransferase family protein n=1 Tax=Novosphingobium sp. TaxID=1874826 RepID=UPI0025F1620D|nr:lysophospholipid acyltransferase family protein [Novosphingobium sp.]